MLIDQFLKSFSKKFLPKVYYQAIKEAILLVFSALNEEIPHPVHENNSRLERLLRSVVHLGIRKEKRLFIDLKTMYLIDYK